MKGFFIFLGIVIVLGALAYYFLVTVPSKNIGIVNTSQNPPITPLADNTRCTPLPKENEVFTLANPAVHSEYQTYVEYGSYVFKNGKLKKLASTQEFLALGGYTTQAQMKMVERPYINCLIKKYGMI